MSERYQNLKEFYPFYLSEHKDPTNKILHFIGTGLSLSLLTYFIYTVQFTKIPLILLVGYSFAWVGHFIFEKNRPATFKYPLMSFICDFKMFFDILRGKVKIAA